MKTRSLTGSAPHISPIIRDTQSGGIKTPNADITLMTDPDTLITKAFFDANNNDGGGGGGSVGGLKTFCTNFIDPSNPNKIVVKFKNIGPANTGSALITFSGTAVGTVNGHTGTVNVAGTAKYNLGMFFMEASSVKSWLSGTAASTWLHAELSTSSVGGAAHAGGLFDFIFNFQYQGFGISDFGTDAEFNLCVTYDSAAIEPIGVLSEVATVS